MCVPTLLSISPSGKNKSAVSTSRIWPRKWRGKGGMTRGWRGKVVFHPEPLRSYEQPVLNKHKCPASSAHHDQNKLTVVIRSQCTFLKNKYELTKINKYFIQITVISATAVNRERLKPEETHIM